VKEAVWAFKQQGAEALVPLRARRGQDRGFEEGAHQDEHEHHGQEECAPEWIASMNILSPSSPPYMTRAIVDRLLQTLSSTPRDILSGLM